MQANPTTPRASLTQEEIDTRQLPDEDIRHWLAYYRRELAQAEGEDARAWYEYKVSLFAGEDDRRRRLTERGVRYAGDRFPESFLDDLKYRVHLDAVIERHFGCHLGPVFNHARRGRCPIHGGDNPTSLVVRLKDPRNERYTCHSCGAEGDVFSALMEAHGWRFREAVEKLADECGVQLPTRPPAQPAPSARPPASGGGIVIRRARAEGGDAGNPA